MKGSRVQAVVQELRGEKIDIVPWDPDPAKFICNALAPAEIVRVIVSEGEKSMEVVVPDDQLSLAIGKRGQNVRLASKLSGWHLDVTSESNYNRALKETYDSLLQLEGVGEKTALALYQGGFRSADELAGAQVADLMQLAEIGEEKASKIIESAAELVRKKAEAGEDAESTAAPAAAEAAATGEGSETTEAGEEKSADEQG
jgi:N utilization substance protein A